jgi:arylsulfatase
LDAPNIEPDETSKNTFSRTRTECSEKDSNRPRAKPLNVLVFYPDDWRHDSIGGVGPVVLTPFLNKLAERGIRFTHNCVTTSICWISRASYFTGQYASRHKSMRLPKPTFYESFNISWPGILRRSGYYTGHVGKWQFRNEKKEVQRFFNFTSLYEGRHVYKTKGRTIHAADHSKEVAINFLRTRPRDRAFSLTVAFSPPKAIGRSREPGAQYTPKNESMSLYANADVPMPDTETSFKRLPYFLREGTTARDVWDERLNGTERYQASMKNYIVS